MTPQQFADDSTSIAQVQPGSPGDPASQRITGLKPKTTYTVGLRSLSYCGGDPSEIQFVTFETTEREFTQLSGCFVATAAYGSELDPHVTNVRKARDEMSQNAFLRATFELYYRASPPAADLMRRSDVARATTRRLLETPLRSVSLLATLRGLGTEVSPPNCGF